MSFSFDSNNELKRSAKTLDVLEKINLITEGAVIAFNAMECSSLSKAYKVLDGNWKKGTSNFPTSGIIASLLTSIERNTGINMSEIRYSYEKHISEETIQSSSEPKEVLKSNSIHVYIKFLL